MSIIIMVVFLYSSFEIYFEVRGGLVDSVNCIKYINIQY